MYHFNMYQINNYEIAYLVIFHTNPLQSGDFLHLHLDETCGWGLPHWTARVFSISPPLVPQKARLLLFPPHRKLPSVSVGQPGYIPFRMDTSQFLECPASLSAQPQGPPELQAALATGTEIQIPPSLSFRSESPLAPGGAAGSEGSPQPLLPSLQDRLQPSGSGCALGVTQTAWGSCLPDWPSKRPPDPPWDQITLGKWVLPSQAGTPARISQLVPPFLLGSPTAQAFGSGSLGFLELLFTGNLAQTNLPLHVASILAGFISLVCCSPHPPTPSFFFFFFPFTKALLVKT